ncbi:MAG: endonuclease/exonuclease/phosphatase family protein [Flavobacteriaceae bacterium]
MKNNYALVFYNVENLFDTIDDPITNDNEFLPNAKKHWSTRKYKRKLKNIASVIHRIHSDTNHIPFIVGLAEVENRSVLQDLINQDELRDYNFDYVHFDSRDARGIDVSLLFNKSLFEIVLSKTFPIDIQQNDLSEPTRDILYVKGLFHNNPIHVLVNHWPSRREGVKETAFKRLHLSQKLNSIVKTIYEEDSKANIIVMGDFNDNPRNDSLQNLVLNNNLFNPFTKLWSWNSGTLIHKRKWYLFDQILLSKNFKTGHFLKFSSAAIFNPSFIQVQKGKFKGAPKRSYAGDKHLAGYSDHFPVYVSMKGV